ncbi:MAG: LysR family transcriptional regulator [Albidovulum sp.]
MPRFTLRQLEYLSACIECRSVAAAAEKLNVSQPTISVAIAKLEAQLGVQLLLRHHSQGVSPTPSAEDILPLARSLLAHSADLERQAMLTGTKVAGQIRLGSFTTLAPVVLPGLIQALGQTYPDIQLQIQEGSQEFLLSSLADGRLDLALLYNIGLPTSLRCVHLADRAPYVALPEHHALAGQADVSLAELVDLPLILLDVAPSRAYFLGLFEAVGLKPKIGHSSPSLELVRGMVGHGLGYSILVTRPHGDQTHDGRRLTIRPLRDQVQCSSMVLASLQNLRPTRLISSFEALAVNALLNANAPSS